MPDIRDHIRNWLIATNWIEVHRMMHDPESILSYQFYRPAYMKEVEARYLIHDNKTQHIQWEDPKEAPTSPS